MAQSEPASTSALRRKVAASQDEKPSASGRSALRALRLALARGSAEELDMPLAVLGARQGRSTQDEIARLLTGDRLLIVLDGNGGSIGAMALDRALVSGLLQQQTMGRISNGTSDERPFTGTDAAMAAPLANGMLSRVAALTESAVDRHCFEGYRFGARAEDSRALLLILEADKFRTFTLVVDLAGGVLQGELSLILPDRPPEPPKCETEVQEETDADPASTGEFGGLRAELNAVVCRMKLPISELSALQPGDVIPLIMPEGLNKTRLHSITGQAVTLGRLGRINGLRAVRINECETPSGHPSMDNASEFQSEAEDSGKPDPGGNPEPLTYDHQDEGLADLPDLPGIPDLPDLPDLPAPLPALIPGDDGAADESFDLTQEPTLAEITELAGLGDDEGLVEKTSV